MAKSHREKMNTAAWGLVLALTAFASFSISDMFAKLLANHVNPFDVSITAGFLGILLLPTVKLPEESWRSILPNNPKGWGYWLLRALLSFGCSVCSVEAFMLLPMPEAMTLMFLVPLFTNILSTVILKEHVTKPSWAATIIGFIGILIVLRPGIRGIGLGEICAIAVAVSFAGSIIVNRLSHGVCSELASFSSTLVGPTLGNAFILFFVFHKIEVPTQTMIWAYLFGYGFLAAFGQLLLIFAVRIIPAARVSLTQYSQMVWAVMFSLTLFHDPLSLWTWIGVAIVTFSGCTGWIYRNFHLWKTKRLTF